MRFFLLDARTFFWQFSAMTCHISKILSENATNTKNNREILGGVLEDSFWIEIYLIGTKVPNKNAIIKLESLKLESFHLSCKVPIEVGKFSMYIQKLFDLCSCFPTSSFQLHFELSNSYFYPTTCIPIMTFYLSQ